MEGVTMFLATGAFMAEAVTIDKDRSTDSWKKHRST
jgi:hypothetical protein